jgi:hypothetical protein
MDQPPPHLPSASIFPFSAYLSLFPFSHVAILWLLVVVTYTSDNHSGLVDLGQRNWVGMQQYEQSKEPRVHRMSVLSLSAVV